MKRFMNIAKSLLLLMFSMGLSISWAQNEMNKAVDKSKSDLEMSLMRLSELREAIGKEKLPLSKDLNKLEDELIVLHEEYKKQSRLLDSRNLDLNNLRRDIKAREAEEAFITNLFDEYVRNFKSRVHISELKRYGKVQREAELAPENPNFVPAEKFAVQLELVNESLNRLIDLGGGTTFDGYAINPSGDEVKGKFGILGPVVLFASQDGKSAGIVDQKLGSNEPTVRPVQMEDPAMEAKMSGAIKPMLDAGKGFIAFDPSQGDAAKYVDAEVTVWDELFDKGGVTMYPIIVLALAAFLVAIAKFIHLSLVRQVPRKKIRQLLTYINSGDYAQAKTYVATFKGPMGSMLQGAVDHIREPKDLIEEVMFEIVMETKIKLQSFIAFVGLSAAAAPLLGLLGTVTGMINTFKLITLYGTGDAKMLSGGISEALLTTKWGLIVAIPSVIAAAYLNRKAKGIIDNMEKVAVSFVNTISRRANNLENGHTAIEETIQPEPKNFATPPQAAPTPPVPPAVATATAMQNPTKVVPKPGRPVQPQNVPATAAPQTVPAGNSENY